MLCFEDKLVALALARVLEQIYEADFEESSYGCRPRRTPHQALDQLGRTIQQRRVNYICREDLKKHQARSDEPPETIIFCNFIATPE